MMMYIALNSKSRDFEKERNKTAKSVERKAIKFTSEHYLSGLF